MEGVEVGRYCKIRRAIIDKGVKVPQGTEIGYDLEDDRKRFFVSDGGVVVIARGTKLSFPKREPIRIQKVIDYLHPQGVANWN